MTDLLEVETSDHCRLNLKLAYRWEFRIDRDDEEQCKLIFNIKDFIGDACKRVSSRVRG